MTILFPIIYSAALTYLVWKAFKVMSNGWGISRIEKNQGNVIIFADGLVKTNAHVLNGA